jgi:uncharacterized membrane protein YqjE
MAEPNPGKLLESLGRLIGTAVAIVQTRLELVSNEVEEELARGWQVLVLLLMALVFFGMAILVFTALVAVLFWNDHPAAVLAILGCLYLALGVTVVLAIRAKLQERSRLFSTSLAELAKDRELLEPAGERASS